MEFGSGITVIIPHYGDPTLALTLIDNLQHQRESHLLDVIVVDDASPNPFPETDGVTTIRRTQNGGFGAAVNTGAASATMPLLLIMNSDVCVDDNFIGTLTNSAIPWMPAVVGPLTRDIHGNQLSTARYFPSYINRALQRLAIPGRWSSSPAYAQWTGHDSRAQPGECVQVDWLVGSCLMLPTAMFRTVGGFDERFHMNFEEVDLQLRLREKGIRSVFLGTVEISHLAGSSSDPAKAARWLSESQTLYADKWGWSRQLKSALSLVAMANLLSKSLLVLCRRHLHPIRDFKRDWRLIWATPPPARNGEEWRPNQ